MKVKILTSESFEKKDLLIFFSGAISHYCHFSHLSIPKNLDVAFVYEYVDFNFPFIEVQKYNNIYVSAWSMGVSVCARLDIEKKINKKVKFVLAINGSNAGIHRIFGIHNSIFKRSISTFEPIFFANNMGASNLDMSLRNNYKNELESLFEFCSKDNYSCIEWCFAIACMNDCVFPATSVIASFKDSKTVVKKYLNEPHFVFYKFSSWGELCKNF